MQNAEHLTRESDCIRRSESFPKEGISSMSASETHAIYNTSPALVNVSSLLHHPVVERHNQ